MQYILYSSIYSFSFIMLPSFSKIKILPSSNRNKDDNLSLVVKKRKKYNPNLQSSQTQNQDQQPNDMQTPIIKDVIRKYADPYSLTFNIVSSFLLFIADELCNFYINGYNLFHDSRTSKYKIIQQDHNDL